MSTTDPASAHGDSRVRPVPHTHTGTVAPPEDHGQAALQNESILRDHFTLPAEAVHGRSLHLRPNPNDSLSAARPSSPSGANPAACGQGSTTIQGSAHSKRDILTSLAEAVQGRSLPPSDIENSLPSPLVPPLPSRTSPAMQGRLISSTLQGASMVRDPLTFESALAASIVQNVATEGLPPGALVLAVVSVPDDDACKAILVHTIVRTDKTLACLCQAASDRILRSSRCLFSPKTRSVADGCSMCLGGLYQETRLPFIGRQCQFVARVRPNILRRIKGVSRHRHTLRIRGRHDGFRCTRVRPRGDLDRVKCQISRDSADVRRDAPGHLSNSGPDVACKLKWKVGRSRVIASRHDTESRRRPVPPNRATEQQAKTKSRQHQRRSARTCCTAIDHRNAGTRFPYTLGYRSHSRATTSNVQQAIPSRDAALNRAQRPLFHMRTQRHHALDILSKMCVSITSPD